MCVLIKIVVLLSQALDNWTLSLNALLPEAPLHRPGAGARAGLAGAAADSVLDETESVFTAPTAGLERRAFTAHPRSVHGNSSTIGPPGFHDRIEGLQSSLRTPYSPVGSRMSIRSEVEPSGRSTLSATVDLMDNGGTGSSTGGFGSRVAAEGHRTATEGPHSVAAAVWRHDVMLSDVRMTVSGILFTSIISELQDHNMSSLPLSVRVTANCCIHQCTLLVVRKVADLTLTCRRTHAPPDRIATETSNGSSHKQLDYCHKGSSCGGRRKPGAAPARNRAGPSERSPSAPHSGLGSGSRAGRSQWKSYSAAQRLLQLDALHRFAALHEQHDDVFVVAWHGRKRHGQPLGRGQPNH